MIELKDVSKQFSLKEGVIEALSDITIKIDDGEIVGIVGYSGAGKSTLLRLLNGLAIPTSGEVYVDGINPNNLSRKEKTHFCQKFGMIFQHFHLLWSRTVKGNISLALEIAKFPRQLQEERVNELLKLVGLTHKGDQYPATLSGGEKQRVGIARALANHPRYLLCDEATSALDPENTRSILELLQDVRKKLGVTIVFITHQMEVVQSLADRVIVMNEGRIVEENDLLSLLLQPKHEVTKRFVKSIVDPGDFISWDQSVVYRLSYVDTLSSRPLISEVIRGYQVEVNILQGKISRVGNSAYGTLYVTIQGIQTQEAIEYLRNQGVKVVIENGSMG